MCLAARVSLARSVIITRPAVLTLLPSLNFAASAAVMIFLPKGIFGYRELGDTVAHLREKFSKKHAKEGN